MAVAVATATVAEAAAAPTVVAAGEAALPVAGSASAALGSNSAFRLSERSRRAAVWAGDEGAGIVASTTVRSPR